MLGVNGATTILTFVPTTCGPFVGHSRLYSKLFWVLFKQLFASPTHGEGAGWGSRHCVAVVRGLNGEGGGVQEKACLLTVLPLGSRARRG